MISRRQWIQRIAVGATAVLARTSVEAQSNASANSRSALRYPELRLINLAGNENPFGPSPGVAMAISQAIATSCRYPFREEVILREAIAEREGVKPEQILLGNGGDEILSMAASAFVANGRSVVAAKPTYSQLMDHAERQGGQIIWVPHCSDSMKHDLPAMEDAISSNTNLVYICNPDTPSGTHLAPDAVEQFCRTNATRCPIFIDEVYLDLLDSFEQETQVQLVREGLPIIILRSFSKLHALAGHRVGYAIAPQELITELAHFRRTGLNFLGVAAARASLNETRFHRFSREQIRAGREKYCELLDEIGLRYIDSVGNFVFHETRGINNETFQARMRTRGFLTGRTFAPYQNWTRISIGTADEMRQFSDAMRQEYT